MANVSFFRAAKMLRYRYSVPTRQLREALFMDRIQPISGAFVPTWPRFKQNLPTGNVSRPEYSSA
jgi:hypothetical protein